MEKCAAWDKEPQRRTTEATVEENARLRADQARRDELATKRAESAEVKTIGSALAALIPEDMDTKKGDRFFDYAVRQLQQHVEANAEHYKKNRLDPADVPQILADLGVLQDFGLSVEETPTPAAKPPLAKPAPPKGAAVPARAKAPATTGADLRKRVETRKAAATAPAGAGSATTGQPPLPKGHSWEEKKSWLKKQLGLP
jgi:hypothetical protein